MSTIDGFWVPGLKGTPDNMNACLLLVNTYANIPTAASYKRCCFWATDQGQLYYSDGSSWNKISTPASMYENGGADEMSVAGLSGELVDDQPPKLHTTAKHSDMVGASVFNASDQTISDSTITALAFTAERFDDGGYHDCSTNNSRFTVPSDGIYIVTGRVVWTGDIVGYRYLMIRKNGTTDVGNNFINNLDSSVVGQHISEILSLSTSDYVELCVYQTSGGDIYIRDDEDIGFSIFKLGA